MGAHQISEGFLIKTHAGDWSPDQGCSLIGGIGIEGIDHCHGDAATFDRNRDDTEPNRSVSIQKIDGLLLGGFDLLEPLDIQEAAPFLGRFLSATKGCRRLA